MSPVRCFTVFVSLVLFFGVEISSSERVVLSSSRDALLPEFNLVEYVTNLGYVFEVHENLRTEDGYILTLHRIPHGKNESSAAPRPPVLLMHGLGGTASNWVDAGPDYGLGFLLADRGYDVWLGNARGTTHSKKHASLDPEKDESKYWDFSWHEIGYYDLPTKMNHIAEVTKQQQLFYVGHSQGCTAYLVMMATRPEMNDRIKLMTAMAPAVYGLGDQLKLPKPVAYALFRQLDFSRKALGIYTDPFGPRMEEFFCKSAFTLKVLCDTFLDARSRFMGFDPEKTRPEHWMTIKQTVPDSSSVKESLHYIQVALSDEFRQYDLGTLDNRKKYGASLPPFYDLSKITSRIAIFYGEEDTQATPHNVERVVKMLPNVVSINSVPGLGIVDFLAADSAVELVYKEVFALMYNYAN